MSIATTGGTGHADLYVSGSTWPTTGSYDQKPADTGNGELVVITAPTGGTYYYITLNATEPFSGVSISANLSPSLRMTKAARAVFSETPAELAGVSFGASGRHVVY